MPSERHMRSQAKRLLEKGLPKNTIVNELKAKLRRDLTYSSGKILCSMCTQRIAENLKN